MDRDLRKPLPPLPLLPEGYYFVPWDDGLLQRHAQVKFDAFHNEYDAALFVALSSLDGCIRLMGTIRELPGFVACGTWLLANAIEDCGTIQCLNDGLGGGAIQNVGVTPAYRGRGLGEALVIQSLYGIRAAGLHKATLEVTADNYPAIRLYRRLGFRTRRIVYKPLQGPLPLVAEAGTAR
jgi:ribosomal protein S18 acetylase RimI-like enzyme